MGIVSPIIGLFGGKYRTMLLGQNRTLNVGTLMAFNLAEQFVSHAEIALGAMLPASYCIAMMENNGGTVDAEDENWELFPIRDTSDRKRLARSINDIVTETKSCSDWPGFPQDVVVIAQNGSGDYMVFHREGNAFLPAVHVWRHETRTVQGIVDDFAALKRLD